MKMLLVAVAAAVPLVCHAATAKADSHLEMTCYPLGGAPYKVAAIDGTTLLITSLHGITRSYRIVRQSFSPKGWFIVVADGYNARGERRRLAALFAADSGLLDVTYPNPGTDKCGSDLDSGSINSDIVD